MCQLFLEFVLYVDLKELIFREAQHAQVKYDLIWLIAESCHSGLAFKFMFFCSTFPITIATSLKKWIGGQGVGQFSNSLLGYRIKIHSTQFLLKNMSRIISLLFAIYYMGYIIRGQRCACIKFRSKGI